MSTVRTGLTKAKRQSEEWTKGQGLSQHGAWSQRTEAEARIAFAMQFLPIEMREFFYLDLP
jgi:hypothetical protein